MKKDNYIIERNNTISFPLNNLKISSEAFNDTSSLTSLTFNNLKNSSNYFAKSKEERLSSATKDEKNVNINKTLDATQFEKDLHLQSNITKNSLKIRDRKFILHKPKAIFVQQSDDSTKEVKYFEPKMYNKKPSVFENHTTSSKASINKNLISSRTNSENSSLRQKYSHPHENNISSLSNHCLIHKRYIQHALSKSFRAPLRTLLDSGGKLASANGQSEKLNAYIISENYQEKLILLNEKTQHQIKQRELYNQFKSKRSISFNRPIMPQSTNPNFLITQHKI